VEEAVRLRAETEDRLSQVTIDRQAVEASIRHHTLLVEQAYKERLAAERRVAELAQELADLRAAVLTTLREKGSKKALASLEAQLTELETRWLELSEQLEG
jgi:glycyl-tRNA synthetase (class II)